MRPNVREEVVENLAQAFAIADHLDRIRDHDLERAAGIEHAGGIDRVGGNGAELDRLALERPALVEAGEEQQVVDEQAHPA